LLVLGLIALSLTALFAQADQPKVSGRSGIRVGERLSYSISFDKVNSAGTAELYVASQGKFLGKDVIEIRSRARTVDLVAAAFLPLDESRVVYVDPVKGMPVYSIRTSNIGIPKDSITNNLKVPATYHDLLTVIYKARESAGTGSFNFTENEQVYTAAFQSAGTKNIKTDAGTFETTRTTVTSDFLTLQGITSFEIYFSNDEWHVPVEFQFRTVRGLFRATLIAMSVPDNDVAPVPTPTPVTSPTPVRPRPTPTPDKYVDNQPINPDLGFQIGEVLTYKLTNAGKPIGTLVLKAAERKMFQRADSLLLTATVTAVEPGVTNLRVGDAVSVRVDPETLAPIWYEAKFSGGPPGLNQTLTLDKASGDIRLANRNIDSPIGTHTVLSLVYAMRSFNLRSSQNRSNPVNDTRVAVFWEELPYVFTLRPSAPAEITLDGRKMLAQLVAVKTDNRALDALAPKVWLGNDDRVPLRFSFGPYQADLVIPQPEIP
jgi:hypothetical protein